jgi:hypothetical protein
MARLGLAGQREARTWHGLAGPGGARRGQARRGTARRGEDWARHGQARLGTVWHGAARRGEDAAGRGGVRRGQAGCGEVRRGQGAAWLGEARRGMAWPGMAWQGGARHGEARTGRGEVRGDDPVEWLVQLDRLEPRALAPERGSRRPWTVQTTNHPDSDRRSPTLPSHPLPDYVTSLPEFCFA